MKINWGLKLLITYIIFIAITLSMMIFTTTLNTDKVIDNYYEAEINYQDQINKLERTKLLEQQPEILITDQYIKISFPEDCSASDLSGSIKLYRPNDKSLDLVVPVVTDSTGLQVIPTTNLAKGKWKLELDWVYNELTYYNEKKLMLE